jgi:transcription elongation factor Elf1
MAKGKDSRKAIPKAVRDSVLKEFNHHCAICGTKELTSITSTATIQITIQVICCRFARIATYWISITRLPQSAEAFNFSKI